MSSEAEKNLKIPSKENENPDHHSEHRRQNPSAVFETKTPSLDEIDGIQRKFERQPTMSALPFVGGKSTPCRTPKMEKKTPLRKVRTESHLSSSSKRTPLKDPSATRINRKVSVDSASPTPSRGLQKLNLSDTGTPKSKTSNQLRLRKSLTKTRKSEEETRKGSSKKDSGTRVETPKYHQGNTRKQPLKETDSNTVLTPDCFKRISIDTPDSKYHRTNYEHDIGLDGREVEDKHFSVSVAVRVRPFTDREKEDTANKNVVQMSESEVSVLSDNGTSYTFFYDHCFWSFDKKHFSYASQQKIYEKLGKPMLEKALDGFNTCLFAYGQTGSGKSYSIYGHKDEMGLLPLFCKELFERIQPHKTNICIEMSFFEIYNEKIHDLLVSSTDQGKKAALRVREHPVLGPYIVDLSTVVVSNYEDLEGWLSIGNKQRATTATGMNDKSSRSHSVFTITITQSQTEVIDGDSHSHTRKSKVNMIDLAGSERANQSNTTGDRLKEGVSINLSLMTLGKVISQLADISTTPGSRLHKAFVPYRESILTWLLKESLGGNSHTTMLATISPSNLQMDETLNTLRYAKQARAIVNKVRVNEDPKARLIRELRAEIEKLRTQQICLTPSAQPAVLEEIAALKEKLKESEKLFAETTKTWKEKLKQAELRKEEESKLLEKSGISFKVNNQLPNLVNLNEDPQLSETLLYLLREGESRVGRKTDASMQEIQLNGTLIADYHCTIINQNNKVMMVPNRNAETFINGQLIYQPTKLYHGDRIVLGGDHFFRFNDPAAVSENLVKSEGQSQVKDYHFARKELLKIQEARIREELEKEREQSRRQMLDEIKDIKSEAELEKKKQRQDYEKSISQLRKALVERTKDFCESEKTRKELEVQNEVLEKEIKTNKRRSYVEQSLPNLEDLSPVEANFLEKIVEKFVGTSENDDTLSSNKAKKSGKPKSLYDLHCMIQEANSLCSDLKKDMVLSQRDVLTETGLEIMIRIHDTRHNLITYWTIEKLQQKLPILRDLAKDKLDNSSEIFNASDSWEKDDKKFVSTQLNQSIKELAQKNGRMSSSSSSTFSSPLKEASPLPCCRLDESFICTNSLSLVARSCQEQINTTLSTVLSTPRLNQTTAVDKILQALSEIQLTITFILENWNKPNLFSESSTSTVTSLFGQFQFLIGILNVWLGPDSMANSTYFEDMKDTCWIQAKELGNSIAFIIQGMDKEVPNLVKDWSVTALDNLHQICCHIGELAMIQNSSITVLYDIGDSCCQKVNNKIKQYFQQGTNKFLRQGLLNFINDLSKKEAKVKNLVEDSFCSKAEESFIIETDGEIMRKIRLWVTFVNSTLFESEDRFTENQDLLDVDHVKNILDQLSSLIKDTSKLTELAEELIKGSSNFYHLQKCTSSMKIAFKKLSGFLTVLVEDSPEWNKKTKDVNTVCEKMQNFLLNELKSDSEIINHLMPSYFSASSKETCINKCPTRSMSGEKCVRFNLEDSINIFSSVSGSFEEDDVLHM